MPASIVRENLKAAQTAPFLTKFRVKLFDLMRQNAVTSYRFFSQDAMQSRIWNTVEDVVVK